LSNWTFRRFLVQKQASFIRGHSMFLSKIDERKTERKKILKKERKKGRT
jgi:hypothetical protein